jgi:uncharacterized protein YecE (DUF72 family)
LSGDVGRTLVDPHRRNERPRATIMHFWIGTSGFQYTEWRGSFYPEKMPTAQMLPYYAERLNSTEINYSFHRIPSRKTIEAWSAATPERFKFSPKAPQKVTHFSKLRDCADTLRYFGDVVLGLGAKLGVVLFQLPPSLKKDVSLLAAFLRDLPIELRATFEFRHPSWFDDETFAVLREHNIALCLAESEAIVAPRVVTADFGYLRLRREDYVSADIAAWAEFVKGQSTWREAFVHFKHEEAGLGPKFAQEFKQRAEEN